MAETKSAYNFQLPENPRPSLIIYRQTLDCLEQTKPTARHRKNNPAFQTEKRYYFTSTPERLESKQPEISKAAVT
jgi:hypothetical protein